MSYFALQYLKKNSFWKLDLLRCSSKSDIAVIVATDMWLQFLDRITSKLHV